MAAVFNLQCRRNGAVHVTRDRLEQGDIVLQRGEPWRCAERQLWMLLPRPHREQVFGDLRERVVL